VPLEISSARCDRVRIAVRNVSAHGIGIRGEIDILPCERVQLHLPDGNTVGATVRWARKNLFGLSLDRGIDPTMLQPRSTAEGQLLARDSQDGKFVPMRAPAGAPRSGFQRTHRDEVLRATSDWNRD
jgi:hypothetical protein